MRTSQDMKDVVTTVTVPNAKGPFVTVDIPRRLVQAYSADRSDQYTARALAALACNMGQRDKVYSAAAFLDFCAALPFALHRIEFRRYLKRHVYCEFRTVAKFRVVGLAEGPICKATIPTEGLTIAEICEVIEAQVLGRKSELWDRINPNQYVPFKIPVQPLPVEQMRANAARMDARSHSAGSSRARRRRRAVELFSKTRGVQMSNLRAVLRAAPRQQPVQDFSAQADKAFAKMLKDATPVSPDEDPEQVALTVVGTLANLGARYAYKYLRVDDYALVAARDYIQFLHDVVRSPDPDDPFHSRICRLARGNVNQLAVDLVWGIFTFENPYGAVSEASIVLDTQRTSMVFSRGLTACDRARDAVSTGTKELTFNALFSRQRTKEGLPSARYPAWQPPKVASLPAAFSERDLRPPTITSPDVEVCELDVRELAQQLTPKDASEEEYKRVVMLAMGGSLRAEARLHKFTEAAKAAGSSVEVIKGQVESLLGGSLRDARQVAFPRLRRGKLLPGDQGWMP